MSVIERDVVLVGKDEDGNECIDLPVTRLGNIEDTADTKEALADNDCIPLVDSADNGKMKKIPWSVVKNKLSAKEGSVTTAGTGAAYTAAVDGITELKAGLRISIVPHTVSTSTTPTLNVNGLGAKGIRRRLSSSAASLQGGYAASWLASGKPFTLTYDGTYWVVEGLTKPDAKDLSEPVPVSKGGTGAASAAEALTKLGAAPSSHNQAASTITAGTFAGGVIANGSGQSPGTSLLRNSKLVTSDTTPSHNGEICWTYE